MKVNSIQEAIQTMTRLGIESEERGKLVALLLGFDANDRFQLFEDDDKAVQNTLKALLLTVEPKKTQPESRQSQFPYPQQQQQQQAQSRRGQPQPQQIQQQQQPQPQTRRGQPQAQQQSQQTRRGQQQPQYPPLTLQQLQQPLPQQQQQSQPPPPYQTSQFQFQIPQQQQQYQANIFGFFGTQPTEIPNFNYDDDEPVDPPIQDPPHYEEAIQEASHQLAIQLSTQYPAILHSKESLCSAMLSVKAPVVPTQDENVPIDLVTILDVSGSMSGAKISLLINAMKFICSALRKNDRLSIVVFNSVGTRLNPLIKMNEAGKKKVEGIISGITANGGTNIEYGLKIAQSIILQRKYKTNIPCAILLSDGQDNNQGILRTSENFPCPIHTFGFGSDHDSKLLYDISAVSRGSYCFIQSLPDIREAFASCIGGLGSIFAQDVSIEIEMSPLHTLERFYTKFVTNIKDGKQKGKISIPDIFGEESKDILFDVFLPKLEHGIDSVCICTVKCSYKRGTQIISDLLPISLHISRPEVLPQNMQVNLLLDKQKNRIIVAEAIEKATELCSAGRFNDAKETLKAAHFIVFTSPTKDDPLCVALLKEITTSMEKIKDPNVYRTEGQSLLQQQQQMHWNQRATYSSQITGYGQYANSNSAFSVQSSRGNH